MIKLEGDMSVGKNNQLEQKIAEFLSNGFVLNALELAYNKRFNLADKQDKVLYDKTCRLLVEFTSEQVATVLYIIGFRKEEN